MIYHESTLRPAIQAAFDEGGLDAICTLVVKLLNEQEARHQAVVAKLEARITELEKRLGKNSSNSSKPPSSDGLKRTTSLRNNATGRKPGGQPGHPGQTLHRSPKPDIHVQLPHDDCPHCACDLSQQAVESTEERQVFELPPIALKVTAYHAARKTCPQCERRSTAAFPADVTAPTQYGPTMRGVMSYLQCAQFLPYERTSDVCQDLFGHRPSAGSVVRAVAQCAQAVQPAMQSIIDNLLASEVLHADETGDRCAGKTNWIHVASTDVATHYSHSQKRGAEGLATGGVLPTYTGILIHDFWGPYDKLENCTHGRCNPHLLRELKSCSERKATWSTEMSTTLIAMKAATEKARASGQDQVPSEIQAKHSQSYQEIVERGLAAHPEQVKAAGKRGRAKQSPERNLLIRLRDKREEVTRFLRDLRVPFGNNQAERDIRMVKVQQKVSGCFRSETGAQGFCMIRSYLSTARKQGLNALAAIKNAFSGIPSCFAPGKPAE